MWITVLLACQEPFDADRHDLVGFRIAALTAPPAADGETITPALALVTDGHPWAARPADLSWYWVEDADEVAQLDPLSVAVAAGPSPEIVLDDPRRRLGLVARQGDREARALLEIPRPPARLPAIDALARDPLALDLQTVEGAQLALEARRSLQIDSDRALDPGGFLRLSAVLDGGEPASAIVRWMATAGTFLELDAHTTDWIAGELRLDDEEIDGTPTAMRPGPVTVIALLVGADNEVAFHTTDLSVGPSGPGLWTAGRWIPTDAALGWSAGDAVRGTLRADDDAPSGIGLSGATIEPADEVVDWGTPDLACLVSRDGPFDPGWLLSQICGRDDVIGRTVVIVPEEAP